MNALAPLAPVQPKPLSVPTKPTVIRGDMRDVLKRFPENTFHSVVTDPPYNLDSITKRFGKPRSAPAQYGTDGLFARSSRGFMGIGWDTDIAFQPETWAEVYRVMRPGAYVVAFSGSRTFGRLVYALEVAGFKTHPMIGWVQAQGMSHATRLNLPDTDHLRYGTQTLKPSLEPIYVGQKPMEGTGTENWLKWGCGAMNVGACRVPVDPDVDARQLRTMNCSQRTKDTSGQVWGLSKLGADKPAVVRPEGRWPTNLVTDGSEGVRACFPDAKGQIATSRTDRASKTGGIYGAMRDSTVAHEPRVEADTSAARFFNSCAFEPGEYDPFMYCPKANKADRAGSSHPTIKPISLMAWLCRLITPPGGLVLDPFAGSGTTGAAALREGFTPVLVEQDEAFARDCVRRLKA